MIFHGTEISIGIFLGTWLAGIGTGASVGALLVKRINADFRRIFVYSLAALGFSLIFQVLIIRLIPAIFRISPAELAPLSGVLLAVPIGTFSTAFLTGFLFPVGCKAASGPDDRFIARIYAFEALGSLAGGLVMTFVLARFLTPLHVVALMALLLAFVAVFYAARLKPKRPMIAGAVLICAAVTVVFSDWRSRHGLVNRVQVGHAASRAQAGGIEIDSVSAVGGGPPGETIQPVR